MRKIKFLVICSFIFASVSITFAADASPNNSNWGIQPRPQDEQASEEYTSPSEDTWNDELDTTIYNYYGSEVSPAFLNRENINPNESEYNYGSVDSGG